MASSVDKVLPFLQEGYFVRLRGEDYRTYIDEKFPEKYAFLYLEAEERIPDWVFTLPAVDPGADSGVVELENLYTEKLDLLYQWFFGLRFPGKLYIEYPMGEKAFTHDKFTWDVKRRPETSYFDNRKSPFHFPSALTELFILKGVTVGVVYYNDTEKRAAQQLNFVGKMFRFSLVTDRDLLNKLEKKVIPYRPIALGTLRRK